MGRAVVIVFCFFFLAPFLYAQYIGITEMLEEDDILLQWDSVKETGHLIHDNTEITFKINTPFVIVNYQKKVMIDPIIRQKGQILLPAATFNQIKELFKEHEALQQMMKKVDAIILDPGHGGKDPGAVGTFQKGKATVSLYEKDIVLKTALILEKLLKAQFPDKKIILTRSDDRFIKLEDRSEIANNIDIRENDAILFISLHANSGFNRKTRGFEVWHLPPTYRRVLIDEKKADPGEKEIMPILNTMLEEEFLVESIKLASYILENLEEQVGDVSENRGLKEEAWSVVRKANMPSLLIELGFLSNQEEAALMAQENYLNKLAMGIYNGIVEFITRFENSKGFTE